MLRAGLPAPSNDCTAQDERRAREVCPSSPPRAEPPGGTGGAEDHERLSLSAIEDAIPCRLRSAYLHLKELAFLLLSEDQIMRASKLDTQLTPVHADLLDPQGCCCDAGEQIEKLLVSDQLGIRIGLARTPEQDTDVDVDAIPDVSRLQERALIPASILVPTPRMPWHIAPASSGISVSACCRVIVVVLLTVAGPIPWRRLPWSSRGRSRTRHWGARSTLLQGSSISRRLSRNSLKLGDTW
jgi:hypothetical protein